MLLDESQINRPIRMIKQRNKEMHGHNTRSASNVHINYRRTNYGKFSLKIRGAQIWNELPKELRISQSYNSFKKLRRDYIQNQV